MKKLLFLAILLATVILNYSFIDKGIYHIKGTTDVREGTAVLILQSRSDTVRIHDGHFEFNGTTSKLTKGLLLIQPSDGLTSPVIIEPGEINVIFKNGYYIVGGSKQNIKFQMIQNQLQPDRDKINELRHQSYQTKGEEQKKILEKIAVLNLERANKAAKITQNNTDFASFVLVSSVYRSLGVARIQYYLKAFKAFEEELDYQRLNAFYKEMPKDEVGIFAPEFTLVNPTGQMKSLSDARGKFVLIDFWFHNCTFCRRMSPHLAKIYGDMKSNLEIISISVDPKEKEGEWRKAMEEDKPTWVQLWDANKTLPGQYGVDGYPTIFLLNREGKILKKIVGYHDEAYFRKTLGDYIH